MATAPTMTRRGPFMELLLHGRDMDAVPARGGRRGQKLTAALQKDPARRIFAGLAREQRDRVGEAALEILIQRLFVEVREANPRSGRAGIADQLVDENPLGPTLDGDTVEAPESEGILAGVVDRLAHEDRRAVLLVEALEA